MDITLKIPDQAFHPGDVIELPNTRNDKAVIVKINDFFVEGTWKWSLGHNRSDVTMTQYLLSTNPDDWGGCYQADVLPGSYHDCEPAVEWGGSDTLALKQGRVDRIGKLRKDNHDTDTNTKD